MTAPFRKSLNCPLITLLLGIGALILMFIYLQQTSPDYCPPRPPPPIQQETKKCLPCETNSTPTCPVPTPVPTPVPMPPPQRAKPIVLLWFWPENFRFQLSECKTLFNIESCNLTDDRSVYHKADAVLIYHKSIAWDLSNLPPSPRPPFQKWVWFHLESPTNTRKIPGLENLFNLTLSYRKDADISVRYYLKVKKNPGEEFVIPKKDKLVCWIVSNNNPGTGTGVRYKFYQEFIKHIKVDLFGKLSGKVLKHEDYYSTIASCKFYLSFENSIHRDYITEKLNGPLSVGTVPVVLGPPRKNYEDFFPSDAFIHVNDFPNAEALAKYLLQLDKDEAAYRKYFQWRNYLTAEPHLLSTQEFVLPICSACEHINSHREYKVAHEIYNWYFS
ncbi:alpha-(1,3)-fucosyltransferase 9-like [Chanos chanos]|uniref:Fucosyltransferase n=1 Tax=Chanos chanos TaxID=29144 RepID=A0A6J2ULN8_CHACN|nr:alpha-(1,3)-fucosyltransferase 9-like [Chanos chanos]